MDVVTGKHPEERSELKAAFQAAQDSNLDRRLAGLERCVDLGRFLSCIVLDVMVWNWDGYPLFQNNYRVFHDLEKRRLVFMPHGMDPIYARRGELCPSNCTPLRLTGTTNWTEVTCEIELRQPLADLEVLGELCAEAWFDPRSLKIARKTSLCP
jgi:hypothetical protein